MHLQSKMDVEVFELLAVDFGQDLQREDLFSSAYAIFPHSKHELAADMNENVPGAHSMHASSPGFGLYVPGGHLEQRAPSGAK